MENLRNRRKIDPELSRNCFWGAAIGAAASVIGGNAARGQANKMARKAGKQYEQAGEQYDLLGGYADDWMSRYDELYAPIEQGLAEQVQAGPDYEGVGGRAATDTTLAYDRAQQGEQRRLQRYGIDPSMGRGQTGSELDRARTEVMAKNRAYDREEDKDWARKMTFTQMGRGLEAGAAGIREGIAGGRQNMGGSYMGASADAGARAGSLYGMAGGALSTMINQMPSFNLGGGDSGGGGGVSGFDYGIPTSNVFGDVGGGGFDTNAGYGDNYTDYG